MKSAIFNKKLKSLASRCISEIDSLSDSRYLLNYYDVDLQTFMRQFLIDELGFKEPPKVHQAQRPERKTGERPEKRPDRRPKPPSRSGGGSTEENFPSKPKKPERQKEGWEKKLYKKIMMQIHPDRLDSVSKGQRDKLRRIEFSDRMQKKPSSAEVLSIGIQLEIPVELDMNQQSLILRKAINDYSKNQNQVYQMIGWIWGESIEDPDTRLQVVKKLLKINSINPPPDEITLDYIKSYK